MKMKYFDKSIEKKVTLFRLIKDNTNPIDFRFGNLKHMRKKTKDIIKKNNIRLYCMKNIQGHIGAFCSTKSKEIVISELVLKDDVDILESIILHEIGHILCPDETCHTEIDKYVVKSGLGAALYNGLKIYVYANGHLMKDEPSVIYRRRKIKEIIKEYEKEGFV